MNPIHDLGAIPVTGARKGVRFSLYSASARHVKVAVYDQSTYKLKGIYSLERDNLGSWSGLVTSARVGDFYVYHVGHMHEVRIGHYFNARHGLLDPYARELEATEGVCGLPELVNVIREPQINSFNHTKPAVPWHDTVIYEAHVKGLTALCQAVPEEIRGTYLGVCHPYIIEHLQSLGVTTLELMPCQAMMDELWLQRKGLTNYWGYNPVVFMAPTARYAKQDTLAEFTHMVNKLNEAGIEVIVDLVFNHTAEGDSSGPVIALKGIDPATYYLIDDREKEPFVNFTGCGNTLNATHSKVVQLWMDALRVWYLELGVDGFRFDLGVTLGRHGEHFNPDHPFFVALQQDHELKHAKIIMEPWDLGPNGYQVGKFPASFAEWNGSFRDTVRTYIRGDGGALQEFAAQFVATFDKHFQEKDRTETSINFVTAHDGFTLRDLVSYQSKHNDANGEKNQDGCHENFSRNYGVEGDTDKPNIRKIRLMQKRNFLTVLALAKGVPMLLMGDEIGRTQKGNNNAYCQDNEISWVDWQVETNNDLRKCWRNLVQIRRDYAWIYQPTTAIHWNRPDGQPMGRSDWEKWYARSVGCQFLGVDGQKLFIIFNMHDGEIEYKLPDKPIAHGNDSLRYYCLLDTSKDADIELSKVMREKAHVRYIAAPHSISVFSDQITLLEGE